MPALEDRIEHGRKIGQFLVALQLQMPSSDGLPHGLASRAADRRGEVHVKAYLSSALRGLNVYPKKVNSISG
jgi:hypothetical protein